MTAASHRLPGAYWRLVTAHGISNIGDGVLLVALPLLAVRLTDDPVAISLISAAAVVPWLILSLPVGAMIDRSDRRRIMVWANMVRAAALALLCVTITLDAAQIWMLWVAALVLGCAEVFYDNSSQALVPDLVRGPLLEKANGRMYSVEFSTNAFIGTPLGSLLFAVAVALPFGIDAVSFVIATLLILTIRGNFRHVGVTRHETDSLYAEMRTGVRWLWRNPLLRTIAISLGLSNLAFQMPQAVFVLFARDELGVSERGYGFLFAIMGVGAVIGGLLGDRIVALLGQSATIYWALATWIATLLAVGLYPVTWWVTVALAIESMAAAVWNVVTVSLRQQVVPSHLFGRINSVYRWFGWGTLPLGSVLGGLVAHTFGLRATYFAGAAVMVVALLVAMRHVNTASIVRALVANRVSDGTDATPVAARAAEDDLFEPR